MEIFALGSNGSGQLGLGHHEDAHEPEKVPLPENMCVPSIERLAAGGNHTLILLESGEIYASGLNRDGRCGHREVASDTFRLAESFQAIHYPAVTRIHFRNCSATWDTSFAVGETLSTSLEHASGVQSVIIGTGSGQKGELGAGPSENAAPARPCLVDKLPPEVVIDVSSGLGHTVAVFANGEVWGWGHNSKAQLGSHLRRIEDAPRRIEGIDFDPKRVVCGKDFTLVAGPPATGKFKVFGSNKHKVQSDAPLSIAGWKELGASWGSIFVLLDNGHMLSWGRNDHGQLCPKGLPKVKTFAAGSEHVVALTTEGKAIAWGWGEHGNCGQPTQHGDVAGTWNELTVPGRIQKVGAGCATSFIFTIPEIDR